MTVTSSSGLQDLYRECLVSPSRESQVDTLGWRYGLVTIWLQSLCLVALRYSDISIILGFLHPYCQSAEGAVRTISKRKP